MPKMKVERKVLDLEDINKPVNNGVMSEEQKQKIIDLFKKVKLKFYSISNQEREFEKLSEEDKKQKLLKEGIWGLTPGLTPDNKMNYGGKIRTK